MKYNEELYKVIQSDFQGITSLIIRVSLDRARLNLLEVPFQKYSKTPASEYIKHTRFNHRSFMAVGKGIILLCFHSGPDCTDPCSWE